MGPGIAGRSWIVMTLMDEFETRTVTNLYPHHAGRNFSDQMRTGVLNVLSPLADLVFFLKKHLFILSV